MRLARRTACLFLLTAFTPAAAYGDKSCRDESCEDEYPGDEYRAAAVTVSRVRAIATVANAPVAGGYLHIRNEGAKTDYLTGGSASFADTVEVHEMKMDGDIMRMRALPDGLSVPAKGARVLEPGGYHLMFSGLKRPLRAGRTYALTLYFRDAGPLAVKLQVKTRRGFMSALKKHKLHGKNSRKNTGQNSKSGTK